MELIKISDNVYEYYKENIKNNKDTDRLTAQKKLTRNWILGTYRNATDRYEYRNWGNCFMKLDKKTNVIIGLLNDRTCIVEFNVDPKLRERVEQELGLKSKVKEEKTGLLSKIFRILGIHRVVE
jgi:hypothetical protein